jgi:hypothetical protein
LGWWICQIIEDVITVSRPFMSESFNKFPRFHLVNLLVSTVPNLAFGLKVQIDTFKSVNKLNQELPRKMVVDMGWIQNMISYINVFLPFVKKFKIGPFQNKFEIPKRPLFYFRIFRDFLNSAINLSRVHLMQGFHIVGLLSSSWQGGNVAGGKRKEVIEALKTTKEHKNGPPL